jgi:hypothetical protein
MKEKCEICGNNNVKLDTHHIKSITKGGNNSKSNKCRICPNCHRLVHEGKIIIEGRFLTSGCNGKTELIHRKFNEKSITNSVDPEVWIYGMKNEEILNLIYIFSTERK